MIQSQMTTCSDTNTNTGTSTDTTGTTDTPNEPECVVLLRYKLQIQSHLLNARKKYCDWNQWEAGWVGLCKSSINDIQNAITIAKAASGTDSDLDSDSGLNDSGGTGPGYSKFIQQLPILNPFDSLLLPYIPKGERLLLAESASEILSGKILLGDIYNVEMHRERNRNKNKNKNRNPSSASSLSSSSPVRRLNIGFMSYDFNNHPTAHLVEAIFVEVHKYRTRTQTHTQGTSTGSGTGTGSDTTKTTPTHHVFDDVNLFIYSYGRNDNSSYRNNLMEVM